MADWFEENAPKKDDWFAANAPSVVAPPSEQAIPEGGTSWFRPQSAAQANMEDARAYNENAVVNTPLVDLPQIPINPEDSTGKKLDTAAVNMARGFVSGMTSPRGLGTIMNPLVGLLEMGAMPGHVAEEWQHADTPEKKIQAAVNTVGAGALAALPFLAHGAQARPKGVPRLSEVLERPTEPPPPRAPATQAEVAPMLTEEQRYGGQTETTPETLQRETPAQATPLEQPVPAPVEPAIASEAVPRVETPAEPIGVTASIAEIQRRNGVAPELPTPENTIEPRTAAEVGAPEVIGGRDPVSETPLGEGTAPLPEPQPRPEGAIPDAAPPSEVPVAPEIPIKPGDEAYAGGAPETTGLKKAVVDTERLTRDADPIPAAEVQREADVVRGAEEVLQKDATAGESLVGRIMDYGEKAISEHDAAVLLVERRKIMNERAMWEERLSKGDENARKPLDDIEVRLDRLDNAQREAGRTWGRLGHMYQRLIKEDFSLEAMESRARAVTEGPLEEPVRAKVKGFYDRIQKARNEVGSAEAMADFEASLKGARGQTFSAVRFLETKEAKARQRIIARRGKLYADPLGVQSVAALADEAIIGAAHIARGVKTFADWSGAMIKEFGDGIKPYLQSLFAKSRELHESAAKAAQRAATQARNESLEKRVAKAKGLIPEKKQTREPVVGDLETEILQTELDKIKAANKAAGYPEKYNTKRQKNIEERIKELQRRQAAGEEIPKRRTQPKTKETERAEGRLIEAEEAFKEWVKNEEHKRRSVGKKVLSGFGEVRGFVLGMDAGQLGRQGLFAWSRPQHAIPATVQAFKALFSDEAMYQWKARMRDTEINGELAAPIRKKVGLQETNTMNHPEELVVTRLLRKIPDIKVGGRIIKLSKAARSLERFQTTFINDFRIRALDAGIKRGFSLKELQNRAEFINNATGRGNINRVPEILNNLMTAPRYEASRWAMLTEPFKNLGRLAKEGTKGNLDRGSLANLQDMAVTAAEIYALYKIAEVASGYQVNWNPTSTDFLKMRKGKDVWDVSAGLAPRIRDVMRLYAAWQDPSYQQNWQKTIGNMATRTINPAIRVIADQTSAAAQKMRGKKEVKLPFTGMTAEDEETGFIAVAPLIVQSINKAIEDGFGAMAWAGAREFVGTSVGRYPAPEDKKGSGKKPPRPSYPRPSYPSR